jgi:hypothetical protein
MALFLYVNRGADEVLYLRTMSEFVAATEVPWDECLDDMIAVMQNFSMRVRRWHVLTNLLTPAIAMMGNGFARAETVNRLAVVDVAIARYRAQHGRPPEDLAALAPEFLAEVPLDPTSAAPFTYRVTDAGFLLYSPTHELAKATGTQVDAETGANPILVFRWPPLPDEPKKDAAEAAQADDPVEMNEEGEAAPADDAAEPPADATGEAPAEPHQ